MKKSKKNVSESSSDEEINQKQLEFEPSVTSTQQKHNITVSSDDDEEENHTSTNNSSTSRASDSDSNSSNTSVSEASVRSKINVLQNVVLNVKPKLEDFAKRYEKIEFVDKIDFENLSDSEEISLIEIPNDVNAKEMKKAHIDFDETDSILELSSGQYSIQQTCIKEKNILLVLNKPLFVKSLKTYTLLPYIKQKKKKNKHRVPDEAPIPIPINLKERHPLFGADFKQKIVLDPLIERKLDESLAKINTERTKQAKKSKKEKMKRIKQEKEEVTMEIEAIFQILNESRPEKRTKNKNAENSKEMTVIEIKKESFIDNNSETVNNKSKKRKIKQEPVEEEASSIILPPEKKKKKKEVNSDDFIPIETEESPKVSPKKKRLNSTLMVDVVGTPQFNPEVSVIKKEKSKKKRKRTNSTYYESDESHLKLDILNNVRKSLLINDGKKKKQKVV